MLPSSGHGCEQGPAVRGTDTHLGPAAEPGDSPPWSTPAPRAVTHGGPRAAHTETWAPLRDPQRQDIADWGSPTTTHRRSLGLTAPLSPKSSSCSGQRLSHPTRHPPPQTQHCEWPDPCSPPSQSLQSPGWKTVAGRPGSPGARLPPARLQRGLGPSSSPAARRTYCCRIMGILTQLAAATAAKGTQRASKGGARCGRQAGVSAGGQDAASCPPGPGHAYLGVEVESHCGDQGCTGGGDVSHPHLPGQCFAKRREKRNTSSDSVLLLRCPGQGMGGLYRVSRGVPTQRVPILRGGTLTSARWGRRRCGWYS